MSGRYERLNPHDEEDLHSPVDGSRGLQPVPNSPPPSFHSRQSSPSRTRSVNPDLADAFNDDDDSEDEADDRQRLMRQNSDHGSAQPPQPNSSRSPIASYTPAPPAPPSVVPTPNPSASRGRVMGGGMGSDGVFANLSARPERGNPESEKEEQPPTYEQAAADAAPPYWETTILAPGFGGTDEVYIDGMPVGSFFSFVWNGMISIAFQPLIGFLLTYLLHSTHAAKNGSLAGLGVTLIHSGFLMKGESDGTPRNDSDGYADPTDPNSHDFSQNESMEGDFGSISGSEWLGYLMMVVGWFILIRSVAELMRARRHEELVLQSPDRGLGVAVVAEGESTERAV